MQRMTLPANQIAGRSILFALILSVLFGACDNSSGGSERLYSDEDVNYFVEVALGSEFGSSTKVVRKWLRDVEIQVVGTPTSRDEETLQAVIADLNALIDDIDVSLVESEPNVEIHVVPTSEFTSIEPNYVPGNLGFFWTFWNANAINRARILIATDQVTQAERSHLIREELTQSLGLFNDSDRYPESIFYQQWTSVQEYSDRDRKLIQMLYRPDIRPGMNEDAVRKVLESLLAE
jgi:hypothetical protein